MSTRVRASKQHQKKDMMIMLTNIIILLFELRSIVVRLFLLLLRVARGLVGRYSSPE